MGKRKRDLSKSRIRRKLRRLEKCLRDYESSDSNCDDDGSHYGRRPRSPSTSNPDRDGASPDITYIPDSEPTSPEPILRSTVHVVDVHREGVQPTTKVLSEPLALPIQTDSPNQVAASSTSQTAGIPTSNLPEVILEALGESKGKQEVFGPKIQEEISERWGRILCEGLHKDQKTVLTEKIRVPENFQLVKAPKLNPEISAVLNEPSRNRDKRLEFAQNYLGIGISALTALISSLVDKDIEKMEVIKRLSEANQILLDLHHHDTINRRKLIAYSLDKKFQDIVQDVKRDTLLFGENLSDKIKATKSAEKTGLQMKKPGAGDVSTSRKQPFRQENSRGPPRQNQRTTGQGGNRNHPYRSTSWKRPAVSPRFQDRRKEQRPKSQPPPKQQ